MFVLTLHLVTIQVLLKVMCHITEGICQALDASLADKCAAANTAEASSSRHQAAAARLVQQCIEVLGIAPEQLFPGWVQRLEGQVRASYQQRLKAADRKAVMAQVTTTSPFLCKSQFGTAVMFCYSTLQTGIVAILYYYSTCQCFSLLLCLSASQHRQTSMSCPGGSLLLVPCSWSVAYDTKPEHCIGRSFTRLLCTTHAGGHCYCQRECTEHQPQLWAAHCSYPLLGPQERQSQSHL